MLHTNCSSCPTVWQTGNKAIGVVILLVNSSDWLFNIPNRHGYQGIPCYERKLGDLSIEIDQIGESKSLQELTTIHRLAFETTPLDGTRRLWRADVHVSNFRLPHRNRTDRPARRQARSGCAADGRWRGALLADNQHGGAMFWHVGEHRMLQADGRVTGGT
jgi:hypothetical protein